MTSLRRAPATENSVTAIESILPFSVFRSLSPRNWPISRNLAGFRAGTLPYLASSGYGTGSGSFLFFKVCVEKACFCATISEQQGGRHFPLLLFPRGVEPLNRAVLPRCSQASSCSFSFILYFFTTLFNKYDISFTKF